MDSLVEAAIGRLGWEKTADLKKMLDELAADLLEMVQADPTDSFKQLQLTACQVIIVSLS